MRSVRANIREDGALVNCCLLVTLPFRPSRLLAMRLGLRWRAWLFALAAVELGAAWLLVRALIALNRDPMPEMAMSAPRSGSMSGAEVAIAVVGAALLLGAAAMQSAYARPRVLAYAGFAAYGVALLPNVRAATGQSHLILMAQTMLLMVVAPALVLTAFGGRDKNCPGGRAVPAGAGYLAVLYLWHLPAVHGAAMTQAGWDWIRIATCTAAGFLFWAAARTSLPALIAAGAGSGLLGLALVVGPQPLFGLQVSALGLSSLADQRLAGLLMMAVDLVVLLPLIGRLAAAPVRSARATVSAVQ